VGGWSLYAFEGRPKYCYKFLGVERFMVTAEQAAREFHPRIDGGGLGGKIVLIPWPAPLPDAQAVGAVGADSPV
jgi:hypothetical protein